MTGLGICTLLSWWQTFWRLLTAWIWRDGNASHQDCGLLYGWRWWYHEWWHGGDGGCM